MNWSKILTIGASVISFPISIFSVWYTRKQYLSNIRPELWTNGYITIGDSPNLKICIGNKGKTARIEEITPKTKNIIVGDNRLPLDIEYNEEADINVIYRHNIEELAKDTIIIKIKYKDKENNVYTCKFVCVNEHFRIENC